MTHFRLAATRLLILGCATTFARAHVVSCVRATRYRSMAGALAAAAHADLASGTRPAAG